MCHLIPRVLDQHGLTSRYLQISESVVEIIIQRYTHEAGVCNLERHLASQAHAVAVKVAKQEQSFWLNKEIHSDTLSLLRRK